jgi:hypothetical protein
MRTPFSAIPYLLLLSLVAASVNLVVTPARGASLPPVLIQCEPADSLLGGQIRDMASAALAALPAAEMPRDVSPVLIMLAPDRERFQRWAGGRSPEWAAGIVLEAGRTILLEKSYVMDLAQARTLLRHELAHVLLDRRLRGRPVPRWFHEGYAQEFAAEWEMGTLWRLARAAWTGSAIPLGELEHRFPKTGPRAQLAYAESQAAVQDLRKDTKAWAHLFDLLESGLPFADALRRSRGEDLAAFTLRFDGEIMPGFRRWSLLFSTTPLFFLMMLLFLGAAWRRRRAGARAAAKDVAATARPPAEAELEQNEWITRGWIDRRKRG